MTAAAENRREPGVEFGDGGPSGPTGQTAPTLSRRSGPLPGLGRTPGREIRGRGTHAGAFGPPVVPCHRVAKSRNKPGDGPRTPGVRNARSRAWLEPRREDRRDQVQARTQAGLARRKPGTVFRLRAVKDVWPKTTRPRGGRPVTGRPRALGPASGWQRTATGDRTAVCPPVSRRVGRVIRQASDTPDSGGGRDGRATRRQTSR